MKKTLLASAVALVLVVTSAPVVRADMLPVEPILIRFWQTSTGSASITSCTEGNYAALFGATQGPGGAGITGEIAFCRPDDYAVYFGLEFVTATGTSGYFIPFVPSIGDFTFRANGGWSDVKAVCISSGPNERVACSAVRFDAVMGEIILIPIPADDPRLRPSGNMYPCLSPSGPVVNPSCATCV